MSTSPSRDITPQWLRPTAIGARSPVLFVTRRASPVAIALSILWLVAIAIALPFDAATSQWFLDVFAPGTWQRRVLKLPVHIVHRWEILLLVGGVLLLHSRRRALMRAYLGTILAFLVTLYAFKFLLIGRARPDLLLGPYYFAPVADPRLGFESMPSGHTMQIVLMVVLLGLYFPWTRWFMIPLAIPACLSRIALLRHYLSDVIAGAGLALLIVYVAVLLCGRDAFPVIRWRDLRWPRNRGAASEGDG